MMDGDCGPKLSTTERTSLASRFRHAKERFRGRSNEHYKRSPGVRHESLVPDGPTEESMPRGKSWPLRSSGNTTCQRSNEL